MKREKIPSLLVTSLLNIEYLTGVKASVATMYVTEKSAFLFLDKRYLEMALKRQGKDLEVVEYTRMKAVLMPGRTMAIEADSVTLQELSNLQSTFKNKKFVQTIDLIKGLRRYKDASEISAISKACSITRFVLKRIPALLRKGLTETDLAWQIESECRQKGATGMAFETIVAFGSNTSSPHHRPTRRTYTPGDLVQIDMGAAYDSYCSDYSRVFCERPFDPKEKKVYAALMKAKKSTEKLLTPGVSCHLLDTTARDVLRSFGYDEEFCHALGHGVGMEIHEGVVLSLKRPDARLKKGDVITIEPGLYFEGTFGMRLEDTHIIS